MRDQRDGSNGGPVKRFSYASSKAADTSSSDEWDTFMPKKAKQDDGLLGLGELDDVWSIRKNVSLKSNNKTAPSPTTNSIPPAVGTTALTSNTSFYSRHGGHHNGGAKTSALNNKISPTGSPSSGFPKSGGFSWNNQSSRGGGGGGSGGGYSYSQHDTTASNSSIDIPQASSPGGGLHPHGRTATQSNTRNMQMGAVYPRSPKPDRHSTHNAKGRPGSNWNSY